MRRFVENLTTGEKKMLAKTNDDDLRIYHMGTETKVVPGFPARVVQTDMECVFIECKLDGHSYHITGNVNANSGVFQLLRLDRYKNGKYRRISMNNDIISRAVLMLKEVEMSTDIINVDLRNT